MSGFAQTNDDLRSGSHKQKATKKSSSGSNNRSSNNSSGDLGLALDACACLLDNGALFLFEALVSGIGSGIRSNTDLVRAKKESLPRIKNLEFNLGYGFFPDDNSVSYVPKLRLQSGVFGTSFRAFINQDQENPFIRDLFATFDWQVLELNFLTREAVTLRAGAGFSYLNFSKSFNSEFTAGGDIFFLDDFRFNFEGRITPFSTIKLRREASGRVYFSPRQHKKLRLEIFGGAYITEFFFNDESPVSFWSTEIGAGFMIF